MMPEIEDFTLSLDEYIRKREAPYLLTDRKYKAEVNEADLDASLDEYIRMAQGQEGINTSAVSNKTSKELGKFDRKSLRDESDDEDDEKTLVGSDSKPPCDSDVDMIDDSLTIKFDDDDLSDMQHFETIEGINNIRVRSQQFRLLPENIVDRPKGARRLAFLPLGEPKPLMGVNNGRIGKKRRRKLNKALSTDTMMTTGTFVEKGNFTYKFGRRDAGNQEEIIGIERIKRTTSNPCEPVVAAAAPSVININFNIGSSPADTEIVNSVINSLPGMPSRASPAVAKALEIFRKKRENKQNAM